ncbi:MULTISPECIES: sensor histidine kinase [Pseudonocardia]|uniref:histidine kinase n=2 Tax=Pseudonocardia TaxID=1847 RepID=A0A1Y2N4I0_PSEAH|nr:MULTISPECIES: HAMP domain-containing sensor histidine kinase [Pseudonocardia]OSY42380.1 Signal transduction histidine-protein kinase ArlS [Pseudonocardia autotrophica]TDN75900.1 signal transduction histidine kinase [Pseudonocardia autotrophica]BBF99872.1 two-component sensor histidine kinase [Pseudonocardia autotrophica]GEC28365.1 two-component sensor histidine kinase [Pseudonocardia saturnea]
MLLLVLSSLGVVTLVTWLLLIDETDRRIETALTSEIAEFARVTETGVNPTTGQPYGSVDEILRSVIAANVARPNEKFMGYLDGEFRWESRRTSPRVLLREDPAFNALVSSVQRPTRGSYESVAGEVRWSALPVGLAGDPAGGVIVIGYFTDQEHEFANEAARLMVIVGVGTALLAAVGAWLVAGRILRPLRDVAATARTITGTDLSHRVPQHAGARDEIAELAGTLNAMLDRVQSGMEAQRRFVDDAGHELRTPITIVRGHLGVLDPCDPDDVADTVALVDDELERMNRLVSEMLALTRAEQPSLLRPELVEVAELTRDLFDKLTGLADRDWLLQSVAPVRVRMDPHRITQAVVALADNATRFTGPGDRIALGSEIVRGRVRIWVADTGPGVAPEDRTRVFRRFARGENAPRSDGAGLGLSIVEAIATTHGGRVLLESTPGRGATFTLDLPGDTR